MSPKISSKALYVLSFAWQLGFFIVVPIGGFLLLGIWGDKFFKTQPLFLILGLIVGIIVSIYGTYQMLSPIIAKTKKKK